MTRDHMRIAMNAQLCAVAGVLILAGTIQAAEPVPGRLEPFLTVPGGFSVAIDGSATLVSVTGGQGAENASYTLSDCNFCAGTDKQCAREGVFSINFQGAVEPLIGASCHGADGAQRFFLMAPSRDPAAPFFATQGDSFVEYAVYPDRIVLTSDRDRAKVREIWSPGVSQQAGTIERALSMAALAQGREIAEPALVADPGFVVLTDRLREIAETRDGAALVAMAAPDVLTSFGGGGTVDELRELITEPWFWPGFNRLLGGAGVLMHDPEGGNMAIFPAAFDDWPDDLDAYEFIYGDLPGAVLRAGPSDSGPGFDGAASPYSGAGALAGRQQCAAPTRMELSLR